MTLNGFERFTRIGHTGLLLTLALCAIPANASVASFTSTTVSATPTGGPGQNANSGVPGEVVTLDLTGSFAQGMTQYGVNKVQTNGAGTSNFAQATSDWQIGFTLSGLPTDFYTLGISYSYDYTLTAFGGFGSGYYVSATYGIAGNNSDQGNGFEIFTANVISDSVGAVETCKSKVPGNATPQECLGSYSGSGTLTPSNEFHGGDNRLEVILGVQSSLGSVNAYNTALITGILVPDGVTWTYDNGVTGNPLNFHTASVAGVPEPGTFAFCGLGLIATSLVRHLRKRKVRK